MMTGQTPTIVIDSYAWIEYFRGSQEGRVAREHIDSSTGLLTPAIVVAECSNKYRRTGTDSWEQRLRFIQLRSKILSLTTGIADRAGGLREQLREHHSDAGLADAIILAHARENDAHVLTGDQHLTYLDEAIDVSDG